MNNHPADPAANDPAATVASTADTPYVAGTPRIVEIPKVAETTELSHAPVVVSLGKQSAKRVKNLEKGKGKLLRDLTLSLDQLKAHGTIPENAQPVIVVVKEPKRFSLFD
jgi:hypothetical protein